MQTFSSNNNRNSQCKDNEIIKEDASSATRINESFTAWRSRDKTFIMWQRNRCKTSSKTRVWVKCLLVVSQLRFNGNANKQPSFNKTFYKWAHFKSSEWRTSSMTSQKGSRIRWYKLRIFCKNFQNIKTRIRKYLISGTITLKICAWQTANKIQLRAV